jgi:hypothetical protein
MAVNFSNLLYKPVYDKFARPVIVNPIVSQPDTNSYENRGIFNTGPTDIEMEDGSVYSDARTILDIRMAEWSTLPQQGDQINIPDHEDVAGGEFEVEDLEGVGNAGGEITIILKRRVSSKP